MKRLLTTIFSLLLFASFASAEEAAITRGRYLATIAGCNDCHTANFLLSGGNVPEQQWLTGDAIGWNGPWGTTYAINLRLLFNQLTPEGWMQLARTSKARPPMPTHVLRTLSEDDLMALYKFIRSLGPSGEPMPSALPPGQTPSTTYFTLVPAANTGVSPASTSPGVVKK